MQKSPSDSSLAPGAMSAWCASSRAGRVSGFHRSLLRVHAGA
jgi:hypothetical protein